MVDQNESRHLPTAIEIVIPTRGLSLKALTFGDPKHPPIIALHGWMDNAASFIPLAPLLDSFYVVALDLPGHGRSEYRPQGASYFHADYAVDVTHAAESLGFDQFILLGHSMGGGVATLVAAAIPSRIKQLILIDGVGPYSDSPEKAASQLGRAITQSLIPVAAKRPYASFEDLLARRSAATPDIASDALALIVERNAEKVSEPNKSVTWQWRTDPRLKLASPTRLTHETVMHMLTAIECAVLNIVATDGMMIALPAFEKRVSQLKRVHTVTIKGHHHLHLDGAVEDVAQAINRFLLASN